MLVADRSLFRVVDSDLAHHLLHKHGKDDTITADTTQTRQRPHKHGRDDTNMAEKAQRYVRNDGYRHIVGCCCRRIDIDRLIVAKRRKLRT